jgi:hypothetical protein
MNLEAIMLSEVSQAETKAKCFLSYVGYRHNTNTSNIMKNRLSLVEITNGREGLKKGEYG